VLELSDTLPETIAAVDLGSTSFHLVVARTSDGQITIVDRLRETLHFAAGLDASKRISAEMRAQALACLRRFGQRLGHMPEGSVRAVGTNTLRSARNAASFLRAAQRVLGHPIETISGVEEARLIYLGVAHTVGDRPGLRLVVDVGGGSTELIVGRGFEPQHMESLYMGCVSSSRRYFPDGRITESALRKAELAALQELEPVEAGLRERGWDEVVGASGTIRTIGAVARETEADGITLRVLERLREKLLEAGHVRKLDLPGLGPERREVLAGGFAILRGVFQALRLERMRVSDGAMREGVLYDLVGRIRHEDVRGRSVTGLADRCHVDWRQAGRVECTALAFLGAAGRGWDIDRPEPRQLLAWAAQLHEIGLDVAHAHYHKHGEYIVTMADLLGFSRQEQSVLATLVRAHRRKFPVDVIELLPEAWRRPITRLSIVLRLACVLHRSRSPEPLPDIRLQASKRSIVLRFPSRWLDDHPLTRADLEQEASYLAAAGYSLRF
jgi:exopolyphosphatase / guanosine-5'-triphosphate,3'-diphosphate pyrophosphatase